MNGGNSLASEQNAEPLEVLPLDPGVVMRQTI
jgi:hypothetical protein